METVVAFVFHDANGDIIGVGRPTSEVEENVEALSAEGGGVITAELKVDELRSLHETHSVDASTLRLVRRETQA